MDRQWRAGRREEQEQPASGPISRLLVLGFVVAGGMGLIAGLIWIGWNLLQ